MFAVKTVANMKKTQLLIIGIIFLFSLIYSKNLTKVSRTALLNNELLDVYIHNDYAFIPGGLGGLNIVEISDPSNTVVTGTYKSQNCVWGRLYSWSVFEDYAYGAGRDCGIEVIDISDISNPQFANNIGESNTRYEHSEVQGNYLFAARHQKGIEVFSLTDPSNPTSIGVTNTDNAWAVLPKDDYLYVADGGSGIKVLRISDPTALNMVATLATSGSAKDLTISGNFLFVAVGANGVDMIDISNPENPFLVSNYNTTGYASRVSANDSLVSVSDWDDVEVLGFETGELVLKGLKNTGGRTMALAMKDNFIFSAEWFLLTMFKYEEIAGPDIDFSTRKLDFPRVKNNRQETLPIAVTNNGNQILDILNIDDSNSDFKVKASFNSLSPGETKDISVTYSPGQNNWRKNVAFTTSDPDENITSVLMRGNYPFGPMPGDQALNFSLPVVGIEDESINLKSLTGGPTVIAFFTAW
jgi:hypothetical protein